GRVVRQRVELVGGAGGAEAVQAHPALGEDAGHLTRAGVAGGRRLTEAELAPSLVAAPHGGTVAVAAAASALDQISRSSPRKRGPRFLGDGLERSRRRRFTETQCVRLDS